MSRAAAAKPADKHKCTEATCDRLTEGLRWGGVFHFQYRCSVTGKLVNGHQTIPQWWKDARSLPIGTWR